MEDVMHDMAPENTNQMSRGARRSTLTSEQVFRLWRCAVKDDDALIDDLIRHVYEEIIAFDPGRAECAMELIVGREPWAGNAFRSLLQEMRPAGNTPCFVFSPVSQWRF
jgi:hypothetical protein